MEQIRNLVIYNENSTFLCFTQLLILYYSFMLQVQLQHKSQHERANSSSSNSLYPQYFSSNTLKYYILLHDVYSAEESRAHDIFKQMQTAFGSTSCHLLQFNSRQVLFYFLNCYPNRYLLIFISFFSELPKMMETMVIQMQQNTGHL